MTIKRLAALAALCAATALPAMATAPAYQLDGTEVLELPAKSLPRDYQVFVGLPDSYGKDGGKRRYPVLFVADANYAFPLIRSVTRRVGQGGRLLEDFIVVGLGYAKGDTVQLSRGRDYTPSANGSTNPDGGKRPEYGQAEAYRRFLADEVFPLVAANYRVDMARKTFAGHSYGALLGAHILLTEPTMFERYALSSPSLWFDEHLMFKRERAYAAAHKDLPAKVLMSTGQFETIKRGDPRYANDEDMVGDMQRFERQLKSRRYKGLEVASFVIAGEDHLTVNPISITRALQWAYGPGAAGARR